MHNMVTCIVLLFRDAGISDIAFHPARCMAVSSSYGGDFKVLLDNWLFISFNLYYDT